MSDATTVGPVSRLRDIVRSPRLADGLVVAVAVSLPWSTSATAILIVLWLAALLPTLDVAAVRRELATPAGALPVLLWAFAAVGMSWADVTWLERVQGLGGMHKLLIIPLLLAQFRRSDGGIWVLYGFLASAALLLVVSWGLTLIPGLPWRGKRVGLPVKDYILQSGIFVICIFALLERALGFWREERRPLALVLMLAAAAFLSNVVFLWSGRTAFVLLVVLALLLGARFFGWKGVTGALLASAVVGGLLWVASPYFRSRVTALATNVLAYQAADRRTYEGTSEGYRLEFWRMSSAFIAEAPIIGHGTGSIAAKFREVVARDKTFSAIGAVNPHNQIFWIAIQLGAIGTLALFAMWLAHLALFRGDGMIAWLGLVVVVQNVVSSMFNSHLVDFTQGWLYVFGVGVIGGMVLRQAQTGPPTALTEAK